MKSEPLSCGPGGDGWGEHQAWCTSHIICIKRPVVKKSCDYQLSQDHLSVQVSSRGQRKSS